MEREELQQENKKKNSIMQEGVYENTPHAAFHVKLSPCGNRSHFSFDA